MKIAVTIADESRRGELMAEAFSIAARADDNELDRLARFAASLVHAIKTEREKRRREAA